jgi:hypothetical protein
MAKYFNHTFMDPWIDHYYALVGSFNNVTFKTFIDNRRAYVQSQLAPYLPPATVWSITTSNPLTLSGPTTRLTGTAPIHVSWARCLGNVYWLNWTDATHWYLTIDVASATNLLTLEFLDYEKQPVGSSSITIISSASSGARRWKEYR